MLLHIERKRSQQERHNDFEGFPPWHLDLKHDGVAGRPRFPEVGKLTHIAAFLNLYHVSNLNDKRLPVNA
jgi:hypothetical protein